MKKLALALALSFATMAQADYLSGNVGYYHDNESMTVIKTGATTSVGLGDELGIRYTSVNYDTPIFDTVAGTLTAILNKKLGRGKVFGELGVGSHDGDNYFVGDVTYSYNVNENLDVYGGVYGDLVDSVEGVQRGVTLRGWNAGIDYYTDHYGAVLSLRESYYSNGNTQPGWLAKAYVNIFPGVNVYVSTRQWTNSDPNNPDFYSPEDYERYNLGVAFRRRVGSLILSGYLETGKIYEDDISGRGDAWRVSLSNATAHGIQWNLSYTQDISQGSNYEYDQVLLEFRLPL